MNEKSLYAETAAPSVDRLPPQNIEAERAVLGSMLIDEMAVGKAIEHLTESSFYKDNHRSIYKAILRLYQQDRGVDFVTLIDELRRTGDLEQVGGASYITGLTSTIPTAANVTYYAKIVKEKAILRSLINASTQIVHECYESQTDAVHLLDRAEAAIFDIASSRSENRIVPMKELIRDSIELIDTLYQRKEHVTGIPTGFHKFDIMTAGIQDADFVVIAGRPSMGKSAFVGSITEHVGIVEKIPVAFFSLEMSREQLVQRMLCSHARVDAHKVRTGFLSQADWPRLTNAAGKLSDAPIYIDDTPALSVLELRAKARRLKAQYNIRLIIVDYLQLMRGNENSDSRQQEISEISRSLKALAKELNVPVIGISQLSRAVEQRQDKRPQLSDLRESGAIEQDADVVLLLLREEYYTPTEENKGIAEIIVAKQRHGPVGSVKLAFIKEYTKFENLSLREEEF